jgi:hypothetical protein
MSSSAPRDTQRDNLKKQQAEKRVIGGYFEIFLKKEKLID